MVYDEPAIWNRPETRGGFQVLLGTIRVLLLNQVPTGETQQEMPLHLVHKLDLLNRGVVNPVQRVGQFFDDLVFRFGAFWRVEGAELGVELFVARPEEADFFPRFVERGAFTFDLRFDCFVARLSGSAHSVYLVPA